MPSPTPLFSLIVPTRQRLGSLGRMLDSLAATASQPERIEVILVVDADDEPSIRFRHAAFSLPQVVVPPGQTMGTLNGEGYRAARGDYIMLLNDDVIVRTPGWDEKVLRRLRRFADGIVLIHVNDTLMGDNLCTFPIVSRTFCDLAGGICPSEYLRYRIDDHIEDIFNLLGRLGSKRTIYMPDVVFEHHNSVRNAVGTLEYQSDPAVLALDAPRFLALFPERKRLALGLLKHIDRTLSLEEEENARRELERIEDPFSLRVPVRLRIETDVPIARRFLRGLKRMGEQCGGAVWIAGAGKVLWDCSGRRVGDCSILTPTRLLDNSHSP